MLERVAAWLPIAALLALLPVARLRACAIKRQGGRVAVIDWNRPAHELLYDTLVVVVATVWLLLVIAEACSISFGWLPRGLARMVVEVAAAKLVGAALLIFSPVLYGAALRSLGESWRMGIDRLRPGPLITGGVYAWSRNPIYVAFFLLILGTCLIHGRVVSFVVGGALIALIHGIALREERFLSEHFGDEFRAYRKRVGRYLPRF